MRSAAGILLWMLLPVIVLAQATSQPAPGLKAKADAAQGSEKIVLSLEYAHQQLEHANALYTEGDIEQGEAAIHEVVAYSKLAADVATSSGKRLKQTEIELRKIEHRMRDIGQSLNIDDRPPVETSVEQLEQLRASLLAKMFGEKAEPKDKS